MKIEWILTGLKCYLSLTLLKDGRVRTNEVRLFCFVDHDDRYGLSIRWKMIDVLVILRKSISYFHFYSGIIASSATLKISNFILRYPQYVQASQS